MPQEIRYTVDVTRDEQGRWTGSVQEVAAIKETGRTLVSLQGKLRDAIESSGAPTGKLFYSYPREIIRPVMIADQARAKASQAQNDAQQNTISAARELVSQGVSLRDVAELMHLSHSGVVELLATAKTYLDGGTQRHEADHGAMKESSRRHGGTLQANNGPIMNVEHVFGECEKCGAPARWTETIPSKVRAAR
jgi:hypothetical protein